MKNDGRKLIFLTVLIVLSLVASLFSISPVKAQTTTPTLTVVYPPVTTACLGDEIIVTVRVDNVTNLYGYDLLLTFDPSILEVTSLTNGTFLTPTYQNTKVINNVTGRLRLSVTQYTPVGSPTTPARSGTGDLLIIKLRPKTPGQTIALTLLSTSLLINSDSQIITPYIIAYEGSVLTQACDGYLTVNPVEDYASMCYDTYVKIRLTDVTDVYGIQLDMAFDPLVFNVMEIIDEGFLNDDYMVFSSVYNNVAGTLSFVAFSLNPAEPQSGSGDVITLRIRGMAPDDTSALTFLSTTAISDRDGFKLLTYPVNGVINTNACLDPTAVNLMDFTATGGVREVTLNWQTANETQNLGFNLYRANAENGKRVKVNPTLISARGSIGGIYTYTDTALFSNAGVSGQAGSGSILRQALNGGRPYYYWLEALDRQGNTDLYGPVVARVKNK